MPPLARIRKVSSVTSLQINYFLCVVKHMSFTKAAAELYITQPSLSKQISNLETELGVRLFDRSVKTQLRLTPAGITMRDFFARSRDDFTQALLVGDLLSTGYWSAQISEIGPEDTVLILGAGPTGICTLQCVRLLSPRRIIVCDRDPQRLAFARALAPGVLTAPPEGLAEFVQRHSDHGGADTVLEVAGGGGSFQLAWACARPNAVVTVVALYDRDQILPLPQMYGKNLTFKTGGVDGCHCREILDLIAQGRLDTEGLLTHTFPLGEIDAAYDLFEHRRDNVLKVAVEC